MVDQACGIPDDWEPPPRVLLRCTKCGKTKDAAQDATDPPNTAEIHMLCPECAGGDFSLIDYFDKQGRQIDLEGKPMRRSSKGDV
jgi:Zn finger protein HypA/HybF involved in hydrogenase expression